MPPFKGSRYVGLPRTRIEELDGTTRTFLHLRTPLEAGDLDDSNATKHTVSESDEIDALSHRYSGYERNYWIIAELNGLLFPLDLAVGRELVIPSEEYFRSFLG